MIFKLACGDVMPGCAARFESASKDDLLNRVAAHAAADHGLTHLSPDVIAAVSGKITTA